MKDRPPDVSVRISRTVDVAATDQVPAHKESATADVPLVIDLGKGNWALFKDPSEVTWRTRRVIDKNGKRFNASMRLAMDRGTAQSADLNIDADAMAEADVRDKELTIAALLADWSLPLPLPNIDSTASLLDVSSPDFHRLNETAQALYAGTILDTEPSEDPKAGGGPAAPSPSGSAVEPLTPATPSPLSGASTSL